MAEMANYWAAGGVDVTLATWAGRSNADFYVLHPAVSRVHLGREGASVWAYASRVMALRALVRERRPQSMLSFLPRSNVPTLLAGLGLQLPIVVSERAHPLHDTSLPWIWRLMRRVAYLRADVVVSQTSAVAAWIYSHWGNEPCVVPNALRPLPQPTGAREELIIGIGRLVRQKGFDLLLEAFARVAPRFPGWRVSIIGEGPERGRLQAQTVSLGLAGRIDFPGRVRDIETWMSRAGLVVQPSRFEGFPNAVLESMGMGAAVISADCPSGPSDLIDNGENGCLVPVDDVPALADAITRLLSEPALRTRLGNAAVGVRDRFPLDTVMARWEAVLNPA